MTTEVLVAGVNRSCEYSKSGEDRVEEPALGANWGSSTSRVISSAVFVGVVWEPGKTSPKPESREVKFERWWACLVAVGKGRLFFEGARVGYVGSVEARREESIFRSDNFARVRLSAGVDARASVPSREWLSS